MREIRTFAKRNHVQIDESMAIVEYLEGSHFQVSVPSTALNQVDQNNLPASIPVAVVYFSNSIRNSSNNEEIPRGVYLLEVVKKDDRMTTLLKQDHKIIAKGGVYPPCDKGEEASINNTFKQRSLNTTTKSLVCPTRCTFFIMYCQVEYPGGLCGGQFYFCGVCFGFW
jgi:hypothetical protein